MFKIRTKISCLNLCRAYFWTQIYKLKLLFQNLSHKQRKAIYGLVTLTVITTAILLFLEASTQPKYRVNFSKPKPLLLTHHSTKNNIKPITIIKPTDEHKDLSNLTEEIQHLQQSMARLSAKRQDSLNALQHSLTLPNPTILGKVDNLQQTVHQIVSAHHKKLIVPARTVENYFELVAVQGFSDGMRAIIEVDGNQTTLGINEVCPACRGWTLKSMDFTKQRATFENKHDQWLSLQAK